MASYDNLKEAIIQGMVAVRSVLLDGSSFKGEELDLAAKNIKRQARIAAHYAIAHLGQGGKAPQPMSQEAKENVIRLVLARVDQIPRSLKEPEVEAPELEAARDELDDALNTLVRISFLLKECIKVPSPQLADALGSIVRGALLSRDCIRKNRLFHATGQRSTETTSTETMQR